MNDKLRAALILVAVAVAITGALLAAAYFLQADQFTKAREAERLRQATDNRISPLPQSLKEPDPPPTVVIEKKPEERDVVAIPEGAEARPVTERTSPETSAPLNLSSDTAGSATRGGDLGGEGGVGDRGAPAIPSDVLVPRPPPGQVREESGSSVTVQAVTPGRYFLANYSETARTGGALSNSGQENNSVRVNPTTMAPPGHMIDVILVNNVISNQLEVEVVGQVWHPLFWNGRKILDIGDRVLGRAAPGRNRDRIIVQFNQVVLKDGRTLPITGQALAVDGTLGVPGYQVGDLVVSALGPILADFVVGAAQQITAQNQQTTSFGGLQTVQQTPGTRASLTDLAVSGAGRAMERVRDLMLEELEQERPYIFVPAGTRTRVYLQDYMDVSQASYGRR